MKTIYLIFNTDPLEFERVKMSDEDILKLVDSYKGRQVVAITRNHPKNYYPQIYLGQKDLIIKNKDGKVLHTLKWQNRSQCYNDTVEIVCMRKHFIVGGVIYPSTQWERLNNPLHFNRFFGAKFPSYPKV